MRTITLTNGMLALVDDADFSRLSQYRWTAWRRDPSRPFYAVHDTRRNRKSLRLWMHREVLGLVGGDPRRVDHREPSETLNNQRSNLRIATPSQNNSNSRLRRDSTSGFKGASFERTTGRWKSVIRLDGKLINLGRFTSPQLAHQAYCAAALAHRGEFARFA